MQQQGLMRALLVALFAPVAAERLTFQESPIAKVLPLVEELKAEIVGDSRSEQQGFDRYQCWCEETLAKKAKDIADGKEAIKDLEQKIIQVHATLGSAGAMIKQLEKDIKKNQDAQDEANEIRTKEHEAFLAEKAEAENCIGALNAATEVMGGDKDKEKDGKPALITETSMITAAAEVRRALQSRLLWQATSSEDMEAIRKFVAKPTSLLAVQPSGAVSLAQFRKSPFGDYSSQTGAVTGILGEMLVGQEKALSRAEEEEAAKQKAFDELMETKTSEMDTLKKTLEKQEADLAEAEHLEANSDQMMDDLKEQLKADEAFFKDTKESCVNLGKAWSGDSELRNEELVGVNKALEILTDPENQKILMNSSVSLAQLRSIKEHHQALESPSTRKAYMEIQTLASQYKSLGLAQIAVMFKEGGHFDKVIAMIDRLIVAIRREEQDDIAHRDRCQNSQAKNGNDMEDLQSLQEKMQAEIERLREAERNMQAKIDGLVVAMGQTEQEMQERLNLRTEEHEKFKIALKDDVDAVALLKRTIESMLSFYAKNKIALGKIGFVQEGADSVQKPGKKPEYQQVSPVAEAKAKAKETYAGKQGPSEDIVNTLTVVVTDIEKEIKMSKEEDAREDKEYRRDAKALKDLLHSQLETKVESQKQLAELQDKIATAEGEHGRAGDDFANQQELEATLVKDCTWVETHFDSRREQRKAELDGLTEAKGLLAGANSDGSSMAAAPPAP